MQAAQQFFISILLHFPFHSFDAILSSQMENKILQFLPLLAHNGLGDCSGHQRSTLKVMLADILSIADHEQAAVITWTVNTRYFDIFAWLYLYDTYSNNTCLPSFWMKHFI